MHVDSLDLPFLKELIRHDTTINPARNQFPSSDCADFIKMYAHNLGFKILDLPNVKHSSGAEIFPVILVKHGQSPGKTVCFLGHIDVVPVSQMERADWKTDPFEPTEEGEFLTGRGSSDMKAGVAAFISAFRDPIEHGTVVVALSGDEEIGGFASMPAIIDVLRQEELLPDFVINGEPSKKPVIVSKRRGGTWFEVTFPEERAEAKGKVATVEFHSKQGNGTETLHSMAFVLGSDSHAMISAGKFCVDRKIIRVESSSEKTNSVPKVVKVTYIDEEGEEKQDLTYSKGLTNVMSGLASIGSLNWPIVRSKYGIAVNPNLLDFDPKTLKFTLTFDNRAMLRDSDAHTEMVRTVKDHLDAYGTQVHTNIVVAINPVNVDPLSLLPQTMKQVCEKLGLQIVAVGEKYGGASDTRFFTDLGIPGIELGPVGINDHGTNEKVSLKSLRRLITIYQNVYDELSKLA